MLAKIDDRFTNIGKTYINRTLELFEHYVYSTDEEIMTLDGCSLDVMMQDFNFYIRRIKEGIDVQVIAKKDPVQVCYMFGVYIYQEKGSKDSKEALVYHHGHGPFDRYYDFKYE
jgi:hypothetical protein